MPRAKYITMQAAMLMMRLSKTQIRILASNGHIRAQQTFNTETRKLAYHYHEKDLARYMASDLYRDKSQSGIRGDSRAERSPSDQPPIPQDIEKLLSAYIDSGAQARHARKHKR